MKKPLAFLVLCSLMIISLVLPSCVAQPASTRETSVSTSNITTQTTTPATGTSTPVVYCDLQPDGSHGSEPNDNVPSYGGKLTLLSPASADKTSGFNNLSTDPQSVSGWINLYLQYLVSGDIMTYGPRGNNQFSFQTWSFVPEQYVTGSLAESWEIMDTGPLTYAFHLRQGIMWTGNQKIGMLAREFTSSDVVFSLKRAQTSPISAGSLSFINKITIVDKYTVSVEMNAANPNWVQLFGGGLPQGAIVAPESVAAGADDWRNAVGTGPFILKDYVDGASATYRKNPAYWEKLSFPGQDRQLPFIDEVTLIVVPDAKEQFAATITGKIDWNPNVNQVDSDMLSKTTPDLIQQKYLNGNAEAFKINRLNSKYLADKNVRRALMIGTDLKTINQAFNNTVRVNNAFWPPAYGIPGLTALDSLPVSQQELWVYNTDTAKKLIAAAGYPNGFTIEIDVDSAHQKEASLCQNLWAGIGVNSTIKIMDSDALLNADNGVKYPDVIFSSYNFNNPFTLFSRLQSNAVGSTYKSSEPFDTMYNSILVTNDPVKRAALEQQLGLAYMDDVGMIPIVCSYSTDCYFPWLKYYYGEMETGYHNLTPVIARMWIDQNLKTAMMNRGLW